MERPLPVASASATRRCRRRCPRSAAGGSTAAAAGNDDGGGDDDRTGAADTELVTAAPSDGPPVPLAPGKAIVHEEPRAKLLRFKPDAKAWANLNVATLSVVRGPPGKPG